MPGNKRDESYVGAHHFDIALLGVSGRESPRQATGGLARGALPGIVGARVVTVRSDGGASGSETTVPSWTYQIWPPTSDAAVDDWLAELVEVVMWRSDYVQVTVAPDDSPALVWFEPEVGWKLLICYGEQPTMWDC